MSRYELIHEDCLFALTVLEDNSVDAIVCDPPYELGFMGKSWDSTGIANNPALWAECLRVLKPGGHLLAFSGSRTYHRMACAIEDGGFEIRDQIMWVYGSGFPKSLDVSKAIDKAAGAEREVLGTNPSWRKPEANVNWRAAEGRKDTGNVKSEFITAPTTDAARQWGGWGTALKPAHEPICVARKPLIGTVVANVLAHGVGALNINGCRVPAEKATGWGGGGSALYEGGLSRDGGEARMQDAGRWPANLIHDGSDEVLAAFPPAPGQQATTTTRQQGALYGAVSPGQPGAAPRLDAGSAARFFYCAKTSKADRNEGLDDFTTTTTTTDGRAIAADNAYQRGKTERANTHPTVKPTDLMAYLVRLVTPPGGLVLDPFMGSGSTGKACMREGFQFIGIEMDAAYIEIARARIEHEYLRGIA